ncbi:unnamed protein product [Caenorhabditis angaria]|uniref:CAAX prenyl protease 2 n=1 Tax=Caenorhabditis angaria TaxID=860376 RepID=A0A9P1N830_9PELO|nr:unnamed protein product [Caenorhabditis angaria]
MGSTTSTLLISILLPFSYVALVNLFDFDGTNREDRKSIKRRISGAILTNILTVGLTYFFLADFTTEPWKDMGFRCDQLYEAVKFPILLMFSLYFGQFVMMHIDRTLWHYVDYHEWRSCLTNLSWFRDVIIGPITEEIVFRSCSSALMFYCLGFKWTCLMAPLPFAASHLHHIFDDQRRGHSLAHSIMRRFFQFGYTYIFGAFATYLHLSTRNILVPIIAHSICNSQGLPLIHEISNYPKYFDRLKLWISYLSGATMFGYLLYTKTGMPRP